MSGTFREVVDENFLQQFMSVFSHIAGKELDIHFVMIVDTFAFFPDDSLTNHYVVEINVQLKFKRAKPVRHQVFDYRER